MAPLFAAAAEREGEPEKLGLALSGGGLRAALFHAGVLARLADLDLLRRVDVLSTVSGGSIVGALYVLHLVEASKSPAGVDYRKVVAATIDDLCAAAEQDLRASTFRNPLKTLWMGVPFQNSYSRSDRIAELYERYLYGQFAPKQRVEGGLWHRVRLAFEDYVGPWRYRRRAVLEDIPAPGRVVPTLMINATVLNTGHPWRFEPGKFGEPRREPVHRFVDRNARLPRPASLADPNLSPKYREVDVSSAVAASACFPGFQPLALTELYSGWTPQLVDGGVYDNQGLEALVHRGCTRFVVSDGSSQMEDEKKPKTRVMEVVSKAFSIAANSIREDHLRELLQAHPSSAVPHLRAGTPTEPVEWHAEPTPAADTEPGTVPFPDAAQDWGFEAKVQERLSRVRTDLDAFSEVERTCLMLNGYRLAQAQLERPGGIAEAFGAQAPDGAEGSWPFAAAAPFVSTANAELLRQLGISHSRFLKYVRILPWAGRLVYVVVAAALVVGLYLLVGWLAGDQAWGWSGVLDARPPVWAWAAGAAGALLVYRFVEPVLRAVVWGLLPAVGAPVVVWHLLVNRRLYLWLGRLARLR